ncbi:adenosine kinase isoform X2 [Condylostylus longicornis]|uniref:adenosine kinase isoform X2 n=1 Tax=Condylostylus longicornis TaxID=2530218 RepID=UPI00244D99AD|nr:adenosine kinase isoform X2 [Condylostylus longicornis]
MNMPMYFSRNLIFSRPRIIAFGNVLLDFTLKVKCQDALDPFGLTLGKKGEVSSELLNRMSQKFNLKNGHPGGSALNTIRILRKIGDASCMFFGAIGDDENGKTLKQILKKKGINANLEIIPTKSTGQCICFVHKDQTGLFANVGASNDFTVDYLKAYDQDAFRKDYLDPQIFYIEGFFLPHRYSVCEFIIKEYISEAESLLAFNLNAPYIVKENFEMVKTMIESSTLIFGNKAEYMALATLLKFDTLLELTHLYCSRYKKIFVVTNGADSVELYTNYDNVGFYKMEYEIPFSSNQDEIKDTTGAGDAFVAGFLNSFIAKKDLVECIIDGCTIANKVIKHIGCEIP